MPFFTEVEIILTCLAKGPNDRGSFITYLIGLIFVCLVSAEMSLRNRQVRGSRL